MKWKSERQPRNKDERERIIFAILPRKCEDGYTRWLEHIKISERFVKSANESGEYEGWDEYAAEGL